MSPRGIEIKTAGQLRLMRKAGLVVAAAHAAVRDAAHPGVTTGELDAVAADVLPTGSVAIGAVATGPAVTGAVVTGAGATGAVAVGSVVAGAAAGEARPFAAEAGDGMPGMYALAGSIPVSS